ncbi:MAG: hypothetical protein IKW70_01920 [Verrucomicrobia bacterium]|nr:hypothetical protein [Verrucomicrobiota bacterium]
MFYRFLLILVLTLCVGISQAESRRAELSPENLPSDTYAYLSVDSVEDALSVFKTTPWGRMIESEEFAPFWQDSLAKFDRKIIAPLQKELRVRFADYFSLFDGPMITALIPSDNPNVILNDSCLILAETRQDAQKLESFLQTMTSAWEKDKLEVPLTNIAQVDFRRFRVTRETLNAFLQQLGAPQESMFAPKETLPSLDLWMGIRNRILIIALGDLSVVQKTLLSLDGKAERLKSLPAYVEQRPHFKKSGRDSHPIGHIWIQPPPVIKALQEVLDRSMTILEDQTEAEGKKLNPFFPNPSQLFRALALDSITSIGIVTETASGGLSTRVHISCPASKRAGITQLLNAARTDDCRTPEWMPGNALSCARLRLDLPKAIQILDSVSDDAYPLKKLIFLGFEQGFRKTNPDVNFSTNVVSRLGDDLLFCEFPSGNKQDPTQWAYLISAGNAPTLLETLSALNANSFKAIGFTLPFRFPNDEKTEAATNAPSYFVNANSQYLVAATDPSLSQKIAQLKVTEPAQKTEAPLVFFREENTLEKTRLLWDRLTSETGGNTLLPFPLNRLNYDSLPSFGQCSKFICPSTLWVIKVTPQGLDSTFLKVFPE